MPISRRRALSFSALPLAFFTFALPAVPAAPPTAPRPAKSEPEVRRATAVAKPAKPAKPVAARIISKDGQLEPISLADALGQAFEHNLDAKFDKVGIKIERARVGFAVGAFDPVFSLRASRESVQRPDNSANVTQADSLLQQAQLLFSILSQQTTIQGVNQLERLAENIGTGRVVVFDQDTDRFEAGVQARTPLGTRFAITARQSKTRSTFDGDSRDITPFYNAFGGIEVRQPLLRDFGPDANLADVRVARINTKVAELNFEKRLADTSQQVMATYFDMLLGMADLAVKQDALAANEKLVEQNQRRLELGFMSPIDVQQAKAAVSQDQEQLLVSKNFYLERQFLLKRLILDDYKLGDSHVFIPVALPDLPLPKLDRPALVATAFERRQDYRAAVTEAEVQNIRLRFAKNQLWPQLDVVGTYGYNGLAFDYSTAREKAYHSQAPEWSIGVQLSIPFGNVQARSQLAAINGFKEQAIIRIKQIENQISIDVDTVISRIETLRQRLETARQTTSLNQEAVRIASRRLEEGQISSFDVIEFQRRLYDAKSRELAARAELNKAVTQLWLATGTMLEQAGIQVKKAPAPSRR